MYAGSVSCVSLSCLLILNADPSRWSAGTQTGLSICVLLCTCVNVFSLVFTPNCAKCSHHHRSIMSRDRLWSRNRCVHVYIHVGVCVRALSSRLVAPSFRLVFLRACIKWCTFTGLFIFLSSSLTWIMQPKEEEKMQEEVCVCTSTCMLAVCRVWASLVFLF